MSEDPNDTDDTEDESSSYQDYQVAKNDRAAKPGDGPSDPAHDFEGVGGGFNPDTLDIGPDTEGVAKDTDGSDSETLQETLEKAAAETWVGSHSVQEELSDLEPIDDVDWHAELRDQQKSEADLLRDIRDRLDALEARTPATKAAVEQALRKADDDGQDTDDPADLLGDALEGLEGVEDALEGEDSADAEALEDALEQYVAAGGSLEDSLADLLAWMREQAENVEDTGARQSMLAALDRLEDRSGGASAAD